MVTLKKNTVPSWVGTVVRLKQRCGLILLDTRLIGGGLSFVFFFCGGQAQAFLAVVFFSKFFGSLLKYNYS